MFPEFTDNKAEEEAKNIAMSISDFINKHNRKNHLALGKLLCFDHRTLIQAKWSIFLGYLKQLKENKDNKYFDGRNEAACNVAEEILTKIESCQYDHLPFI